jgi:hypothetical protein
MHLSVPHFRKLCLFFLLSAVDLVLTWWLLQGGDDQVYEGNPLANWWLTRYGWPGLTAFKVGVVLLVLGLSGVIASYRPRLAGLVLTFACTVLAAVVAYSSSLAGCVVGERGCPVAKAAARQNEITSRRLDKELQECSNYVALVKQLSGDVSAQRRTLPEAAAELARREKGKDSTRLKALRAYYPDRTDEECLAASLVEYLRADEQ